ncbi:enolase C-terminal domain-like protein [Micromonospora sagamiensis]|uniref:L-alanine-DL-glutamate epimerase-like enolase superfamily enzyme n=1 Tax=Micromonospora sagamiensis TaxID=47875 RepID=A0A562WH11_9ACTN|nr:enolase C-terminal domain-like protein [Micromonospora sagamiensis]TWJ29563.1 L-alanine-DL-glutamate epimerase-like enolase superfamily enzyme [Micromonospora sagamiensis]BCL17408.1 dipeptide epimerase [Micromonospora sagamiensis]
MEVSVRRTTLRLLATFRSSRLAYDSTDTCIVTIVHGGVEGRGEGTPAWAHGETVEEVIEAVAGEGAEILGPDLSDPDEVLDRVAEWKAPVGARMALDGAVHDWLGRNAGQPTWRLFGVPRTLAQPTGYTIGIASVEETLEVVANAPDVGAFKMKVRSAEDLDRLVAVRAVTSRPIRIDANEAWSFETARDLTPRLRDLDIQLIEQPFLAGAVGNYRRYRELPDRLPVFLDESCTDVASVHAAQGLADGVVVKLAKSGGVRATRRVMEAARQLGLSVMLSCNCESELALSQAALLAPLADRIDIDSQFLLRDPPFRGLGLDQGRIVLGDAPGLGVVAAQEERPAVEAGPGSNAGS